MKALKVFLFAITAFIFLASCQKEMSFEQDLSAGSLKEDGTGICLPSTINGIFKEDSLLTGTNYIEVQVDITEAGAYIIKSDTINGYSFYGAGTFAAAGLNTVRLNATGRPIDPGNNTFTITYDSTTCLIDVPVITIGPPATYTLGGAGATCTGVTLNGTYAANVPMIPGNSATVNVNVTALGSYTLTTPVVNGISFSGSGDFTVTGQQTVTLNAIGTPTAAGSVNFALSGNGTACTFPVTITGTPATGVFTLGGAGSSCTGFVASGTYASGTALNASNTVTIDVNVTTIGSYTISTAQANGVTFSKSGSFTTTGQQTVMLTGSGVPTTSVAVTYTVSGGSGTCTFSITYTPGASPAAYTLSGSPNACTVATVAGTYTVGTALTTSNTVTVQVNVTTIGAYTLSTGMVNGMTFSGTGIFSTPGIQNVILTGSGTPVAAGPQIFTPQAGASSCTFTVTVTSGGSDVLSCKIDGVFISFINNADAYYFTFPTDLGIEGFVTPLTSPEFLFLNIDKETLGPKTPVAAGTYTNAGSAPNQYVLGVEYIDPANNSWIPRGFLTQTTPADPFTVTITSITATRVIGTFNGTVRNMGGTGTATKIITEGVFNLPF